MILWQNAIRGALGYVGGVCELGSWFVDTIFKELVSLRDRFVVSSIRHAGRDFICVRSHAERMILEIKAERKAKASEE